ncbi:MAG TPA: ABC transporter permease [Saprospiraceae bacterium]|nr:ABC transporter permease [Saprospiraceae bacterium]HRV83242.1 ABC transporter permease [Saprospiraceae bacterium]
MNFSRYIAQRLSLHSANSFQNIIVRLGITTLALSLAVIIVASAIIKGFKAEISDKVFGFWGHIHITSPSMNSMFEAKPISLNQDFYPSLDTIGKLAIRDDQDRITGYTQGGVQGIYPYVLIAGIMETKTSFEGLILKGVDSTYNWQKMQSFLVEGDLSFMNDSLENRKILISRTTADRMEIGIGDRIIMHFVKNNQGIRRAFTVGGIYNTGLEEYDQQMAFIHLKVAQELLGWQSDQVSGFEVFLDHIDDIDYFDNYIYIDVLPTELYSESLRDKFSNIFDWLELQDTNEYVILILLLTVAVINMISIVLIMILERTSMIGILKAMGSRDWQTRNIFIYHTAKLILWGMAVGNFLGLSICLIQQKFKLIHLNEADYYISYAPVHLDFRLLLFVNLLFFLVTVLSLLIPTYYISKLSPVKSIRFN